jgi:hypothetical protein
MFMQLVSIEKIWYFRQLISSTCILYCIMDPQREYQIALITYLFLMGIEKICSCDTHVISGSSYVAEDVICIRTNQHGEKDTRQRRRMC